MKTSGRLTAAVCSLCAVMLAGEVRGEGFDIGIRAGANYSDNVERVPVDETSASSALVGVDFNGSRDTGRLQYTAFGNIEYQDFFEDDVEDETYGQALASATYGIVPDRFLWALSGAFGQTRPNLLRPVAPGNLDDVLTLSTGPQFKVRFGEALEADIEAHYVTTDYSEQPFDSDTVGGSLVLGRSFSSRGFLGLGASVDEVSYDADDPRVEDFDRQEVFLRFNAEGARTTIEADAGYTQVDGEDIDENGPMFRVRATRKLSPNLTAFANFIQEFPTSAGGTFAPGSAPQLGTDASVLTGGPRKQRDIGVGLQLRAGRTDASLAYVIREEEELETTEQRDFDSITATATYMFAPRASFTLFARFTDEEVGLVESDEQTYGGRLNLRLGRLTSLSLRAEHVKRDSDVANGGFEESVAGLFLRYGESTGAEGWR